MIRIVCFPLGVTAVCLDVYLVAQRALQAGWDMSLLGVAVVVALIGIAALTYAPTLKAEGRQGDALAAYLVGVAIAAIVLVANTARIHAVNQANTALAEQQLALKAGALAQQKRAREAYAQVKKAYENAQRAVEYECTDRQGPQCEKRREERDKVQASFEANGKTLTSAEVTHASIKVLSIPPMWTGYPPPWASTASAWHSGGRRCGRERFSSAVFSCSAWHANPRHRRLSLPCRGTVF